MSGSGFVLARFATGSWKHQSIRRCVRTDFSPCFDDRLNIFRNGNRLSDCLGFGFAFVQLALVHPLARDLPSQDSALRALCSLLPHIAGWNKNGQANSVGILTTDPSLK